MQKAESRIQKSCLILYSEFYVLDFRLRIGYYEHRFTAFARDRGEVLEWSNRAAC
jgi:hypothetical protein